MTDSPSGGGKGGGDRPEIGELLSGLDPPRSLPESLRQRLEEQLGAGAPARPLEPELNERLTVALGSREDQEMAMLFSGLDAPRPLPPGLPARLRDRLVEEPAPRRGRIAVLARMGIRAQIGAGVAAACLLVAAVTGIALTRHNSSRPAATGSSSTAGVKESGSGGATAGNGSAVAGASASAGSSGGVGAPQAFNAAGATTQKGPATAAPVAGSSSSGANSQSGVANSVPTTTVAPVLVPQVTSVVPASGSPTGGTSVTIRGLHFDGATAVHFDTMAALNFVVTSSGEIMAITPPHLPGFVNVTVTTTHGTSAVTKSDRYDYTA